MDDRIEVSTGDGIMTIRINRPEKKNALNYAMYDRISDALEQASDRPEARSVLLCGSESCFTSGNDLADFLEAPPGKEESPAGRFVRVISTFDKPLVAAVAGPAIGVGTTMLLHCDLVYAADNAVFQLPFVNLGLVPEAGSSLLLPRCAGLARASELLLLGEKFDAQAALAAGIVNAVLPADELFRHAHDRAAALAAQPPAAVRATKRLIRQTEASTLQERMQTEGDLFVEHLRSGEATEAMGAFMEKRKPNFSRFH